MLWIIIFNVAHQLIDVIFDLENPNFMILFEMHYEILAIKTEVNVDQINGATIIRLFLDVYFLDHIDLREIHISFQKS